MEIRTLYIADDGKEFTSRDECLSHELSSKMPFVCALNMNYTPIDDLFDEDGKINENAMYFWFLTEGERDFVIKKLKENGEEVATPKEFYHTYFYNTDKSMWEAVEDYVIELEHEIARLRLVESKISAPNLRNKEE